VAEEVEEEVTSTWWEDIRDYYMTFDRRTLGLTRIFIGIFLLFDLFRRTPDWFHMYANDGVLPTHYNLWRPQSSGWTMFNAFSTHPELVALWLLGFGIFTCVLIGYKTRVAQVLAAFFVASMNGRVLLIENGGYVVHNLLVMWTAFLPLGDRFSVDAWRTSLRTQKERNAADLNDRSIDVAKWRLDPYVSFLGVVLMVQLAAVYGFNVLHKDGRAWHDGTAVHYVLYVDRMVTPLIGYTRDYLPVFVQLMLTKMVMGMEAGLPVALLSPLARVWARRIAVIFLNLLHIGFGSTFVLGPFAWALCCFSVLLFSYEDWELVIRVMKRRHRRRVVRYDPSSEAAFFWCRVLKRLDRFQLLEFRADRKAISIECTTPDQQNLGGNGAIVHIVAALPGGPCFAPLFYILPALAGPIEAFFAFGARSPKLDKLPARGYQPELKDDDGHPTIDSDFVLDWFDDEEEEGGRGALTWYLGIATTSLGLFLVIYGGPMMKRFGVDITQIAVGELNRAQLSFWLGVVVLIIGLFFMFWPLVRMNLETPSPAKRKWLRVVSVLREAAILTMFVGAINQALVELWKLKPLKAPQPAITAVLSHKMRYLQGWFMFSPNPVMDDGTIVVDAITVDNRRVDPFTLQFPPYTLRPPLYDLPATKSFLYNQIWSDYFNRMHMPANTAFRKPMKDFMYGLPERSGDPNDAIVKGVVYWVHDMNPRFGTTNSYGYNRKELFKFTNPDAEVQKRWRELSDGVEPPELPLPVKLPPAKEKSKT
jgi:hypothetical protein